MRSVSLNYQNQKKTLQENETTYQYLTNLVVKNSSAKYEQISSTRHIKIAHLDQVTFILDEKSSLSIWKSISVTHHINSLKEKKYMNTLIDVENNI